MLKAEDSNSIRTILSRLLGYTDVAMIKVKLQNSAQEASQNFSAENIQALIAIYKTHNVDQQTQDLLHEFVGCANHLNEIDQQLIVKSKHISSNDSEKIAAKIIPDLSLLNIRKSGSVDSHADEDKPSRPTTPRIIGF